MLYKDEDDDIVKMLKQLQLSIDLENAYLDLDINKQYHSSCNVSQKDIILKKMHSRWSLID